jgi:hypothetical protein
MRTKIFVSRTTEPCGRSHAGSDSADLLDGIVMLIYVDVDINAELSSAEWKK